MKEKYEVVVIGAGPVGGYVSGDIAKEGYSVALIEQQRQIGSHLGCAGLITERAFEYLEIDKDLVIQNKIKGANVHAPDGKILTIGGNKVQAYVIDRRKFDKEIAGSSIKKGVDLILQNRVVSIQRKKGRIDITTSKKKEIECNLLIGADGPYSKTRESLLMPSPSEILRGVGAELLDSNLDPNFVEIFVGKDIAPGFFAWIIPTNQNGTTARAGLCVSSNIKKTPNHYFLNFLNNKKTSKYIGDTIVTTHLSGSIPFGALKRTYDSNVLLVGDAAAQIKPTSGGGIYTGILCGKHCSAVAIKALEERNFSGNFLKKYHHLWYSDLGRELNLGMRYRKVYKNLTDNQLSYYIEKFQDKKITSIITEYGDIDYPSKLIKPMLKKAPYLIRLIPKLF
jgi:geranylgeranyl reductase family protein